MCICEGTQNALENIFLSPACILYDPITKVHTDFETRNNTIIMLKEQIWPKQYSVEHNIFEKRATAIS